MNPGQVTDGGELTMCLMHALAEMPENTLSIDDIATWYKKWASSKPFDSEEIVDATLMKLKDDNMTAAKLISLAIGENQAEP